MFEAFFAWLVGWGIDPVTAVTLARWGAVLTAVVATIAAFFLTRMLLRLVARRAARNNERRWDNILIEQRVFARIAALVPAAMLWLLAPLALESPLYQEWLSTIQYVTELYVLVVLFLLVLALLNGVRDILRLYEFSRELPVDSVVQLLKVLLYLFGGVTVVSAMVDQNPIYLLSGLGALTAVLSFVYQDTLRGLMAGIQLTANRLLAQGDWIEIPHHEVSGTVLEVGLATVKVQNFDYSVTAVPTQDLIANSFKNWRGMQQSGGRRIIRSVYVDVNSVQFASSEMMVRWHQIDLLRDYLDAKQVEIEDHNREIGADPAVSPANGRRLTNLGTFRAYLLAYLRRHPMLNQEMMLMVRQLPPTPHGIPMEIYAFCTDTTWTVYETVQADIFDHILAVTPQFGLRLYQAPGSEDVRALRAMSA